MSESQKFGAYLAHILQTRDWTATDLSRRFEDLWGEPLNDTLIRKWIRAERIPSLRSEYVKKVAKVLELPKNEEAELREAQLYSLKAIEEERANRNELFNRSISSLGGLDEVDERGGDEPSRRCHDVGTDSMIGISRNLTDNFATIFGRKHILDSLSELIRADYTLSSLSGQNAELQGDLVKEIYISLSKDHSFVDDLRNDLYEALHRGWNVHYLISSDDNDIALSIVESLFSFLGESGKFQVYKLPPSNKFSCTDLIIAPSKGAILILSTELSSENPMHAIYISQKQAPELVNSLIYHFLRLRNQAQPLLTYYRFGNSDRGRLEFSRVIATTEELPGGRGLVMAGPSTLTIPDSWLNTKSHWAYRTQKGYSYSDKDMDVLIELWCRRQEAFKTYVKYHRFRDIYPKFALVRLARDGGLAWDDPAEREEPWERIEHLRNIVELLRSHPNYEIALLDDSEVEALVPGLRDLDSLLPRVFWEIKEKHAVLFETWCRTEDGSETEIDVSIQDLTVAHEFWGKFNKLWNKISKRNREKDYVCWWLGQQVQVISNSQY